MKKTQQKQKRTNHPKAEKLLRALKRGGAAKSHVMQQLLGDPIKRIQLEARSAQNIAAVISVLQTLVARHRDGKRPGSRGKDVDQLRTRMKQLRARTAALAQENMKLRKESRELRSLKKRHAQILGVLHAVKKG